LNQENSLFEFLEKTNIVMSHVIHDAISQHQCCRDIASPKNLTQRQEECLYYLAQGKTAKEIAIILNLSNRTVEHHLDAVKLKYCCTSRSDLISKALKLPFIKNRLRYDHY